MDPRAKPVVMDKPPRGREMVAREVPSTSGTKLYYEGYINGELYLVPDRNLEEMKNTVNYRIRRRADSRYERNSDEKEKKALQRSKKKLEELLEKLEELESTKEESMERAENKGWVEGVRPEISYDEKDQSSEEDSDSEESNTDGKVGSGREKMHSSNNNSKALETEKEQRNTCGSKSINKKEIRKDRNSSDTTTVRFLISGHCRKDRKPLFIIQRYEGKSPIESRSSDFTSKNIKDNMEIFISGKFYKGSILREENDVPKCITIRFNNYPIDDESKVYEERFSDVFNLGEFDIELGGNFIQNSKAKPPTYTPCITLGVGKSSTAANTSMSEDDSTPNTVYIAAPINLSPFSGKSRKNTTTDKNKSRQGHYSRYSVDSTKSQRNEYTKSNSAPLSNNSTYKTNEETKNLIVTVQRKPSTHTGRFLKWINQIFFRKGK